MTAIDARSSANLTMFILAATRVPTEMQISVGESLERNATMYES